jgi:hypothetical protein
MKASVNMVKAMGATCFLQGYDVLSGLAGCSFGIHENFDCNVISIKYQHRFLLLRVQFDC